MIKVTILVLIWFIVYIYAEKTPIRILYKYDMSDSAVTPTFKEDYQKKINEYFLEKNKDDPILSNYELFFEYYDYSCANFSYWDDNVNAYHEFEKKIVGNKKYKYDMVIVNDRILFNDVALMYTKYIEDDFWIIQPSLELFIDYSEYIDKNSLNFHDPDILQDGTYKNSIYGLPYELDFDLLYYHNDDEELTKIVNKMNNSTWDDVLLSLQNENPSYPLTLASGDDDDLINLIIEYANNFYSLSKNYDKNFFNLFYNETGPEFFKSFRNFVMTISENDVENSLYLYQDDAFYSFIDGESTFLKTKASLYKAITDLENISGSLPPKYTSAITEKYLLVRNVSPIGNDILSKVAYQLTSKEMQLFRAKEFGHIPTFDLTQKDTDEDIKSYCQMESEICEFIGNLKKINIKKTFESKYSPSYFEIGYLLPQYIRDYIEYNNIDSIVNIFENIKELRTTPLGACAIISYIITGLTGIFGYYVMYLVIKYRNNPYLKVVSPYFCVVILFGLNMSIFKFVYRLPPYAIIKARFFLLYTTLNFNLIYIPMFIITYRIFRIYSSKSIISKSLNNTRLGIITAVLISAVVIYRSIITFAGTMYYMCYGDIVDSCFPMYEYVEYDNDHIAYEYYLFFIITCLSLFLSVTGKKGRKFGSFSYIFIALFINVHDYASEEILLYVKKEYFDMIFLILSIFNSIAILLCIYFLVGCRIIYVKLNPNLKVNNQSDLIEYIPLELTIIGYNFAKSRVKRLSSFSTYRSQKQSNVSNPSTFVSPSTQNSTKISTNIS